MRVRNLTVPFSSRWIGLAMSTALLASLIPLGGAAAAAAGAPVPATGGSAISADTALAAPGSGTYTTLSGPSVPSLAAGDLVGALALAIPTGFEFKAGAGAVAYQGAGCGNLATSTLTVTTGSVSLTTTGTTQGTPCSITFSALQVVPEQGTPLASGNITASGISTGNAGSLSEHFGAATSAQLTFSQQPNPTATGGSSIGTVKVTDLDQFGNWRTGVSVSLAIASSSPSLGGALTCAAATTDGSGVATFTACSIDKAPATYTLRAIDGSVQSALASSSIAVSVGSAAALSFATYPAATTTTSLGNVVVAVVDAGGNTVTSATGTVALTISSNSTTFLCGGITNPTATLSSGVATFSTCTQTVANTNYTLTATWTSLSKPGNVFAVTSGPATKLAFCWGTVCSSTVPTGSTGGTALTIQPVIVVQDVNGNTVTSNSTTTITLAITNNTTGATLTCTSGLPRTVSLGVATYSGCAIDKVGTYRLTATSSPYYTPATSGSFVVSAGPPVKLTFTAQPTSGTAAQAFPIQPVVAITDSGGNVATTSSATITLSLTSYTSGGALTCTSGLSRTTVSGVATFSGCSINAAGTNYVITATATNVYPVTSLAAVSGNAFTVVAPAAQITLSTSASVITWSKPVTLTVQFGTNGGNKSFALQTSPDMLNWTTIPTAPTATNSAGTATFTWTPARNFWYRVQFLGAPDLSAANSNVVRVVVRQIALLRPTLVGKVKTIASGTSITFTTTVRPARPELPKAKVTFLFKLYQGGRLVYSGTRNVYIDSAGLAKWTWKFGTRGEWYVRAIANPTTTNANSVWSQLEHYHVS